MQVILVGIIKNIRFLPYFSFDAQTFWQGCLLILLELVYFTVISMPDSYLCVLYTYSFIFLYYIVVAGCYLNGIRWCLR